MSDIEFKDNSEEFLQAFYGQLQRGLEAVGMKAEEYAKKQTPVDTGNLRNKITHNVVNNDVYIGVSGVPYAPYVEFGTGIYATNGSGRKNPWFYVDENGKGHYTHGMKPHHMLKNAAANHAEEYKNIIKTSLK